MPRLLAVLAAVVLLGWPQHPRTAAMEIGSATAPLRRMDPADVAAAAVRYGHWTPEAARWLAERVPVDVRMRDHGYGGFWPGPRAAGAPIGRIDLGADPADETVEHELRHAWDWSHDPSGLGYDDAGVVARMAALAATTDPRYAKAAVFARGALALHGDDPAHLHHFLIHALGFDYNELPPAYRATDFAQGDLSYRAPEAVNPFGPTPARVPTPLGYRVVLPLAGR
jgi:hypothetical protein